MKNSTKLKVGIIGTVGVPACYGGFETLVHYLLPNMKRQFDATVYCSAKSYPKEKQLKTYQGAKLHYIPLEANGFQSVIYDLWSMVHALFYMDVLLVLGVSGCMFLPVIKLFSKKKVIVNIDGLEWRRPKWNKYAKRFLLFSEKMACKYADEIVTDNRILKEYVKIRYNVDGNLIEYGADHVQKVDIVKNDLKKYAFLQGDYAFKVARIEPENHLHTILEAFEEFSALPLVIVGNWNNSDYGKKLRNYYSKYDHIYLLDPIYDSIALNVLRSNAKVYVHGHSAGGTNPSLVEAMFLGLPILSFDVIYNRVTTNNQCIYFEKADDLKELISNLDQLPLSTVASKMRQYAKGKYTWKVISNKYMDVFAGIKPRYAGSAVSSATQSHLEVAERQSLEKKVQAEVHNEQRSPERISA